MGLPKQSWAAVAWLWLATIAWDVRKPRLDHLAFLRDWWMPMALLMVYLYSRGISDDLGFARPRDRTDRRGPLALRRDPADRVAAGQPVRGAVRAGQRAAWYDVALTTVYYSHFFAALSIAAYLWMRDRPEWVATCAAT